MIDKLRELTLLALESHGCERLKDFYECGPVQRAAVETFLEAALARQDAQAELPIIRQNKLLADALASCILASGIVRTDIDGLTGPQLLLFAEDLREMLETKKAQQDAQAVPQGATFAGWLREWEGDDSDLGQWLFAATEEDKDDSPNWRPVYWLKAAPTSPAQDTQA